MSNLVILIQLFIVSVIAIYNGNQLSIKSEPRVNNHSNNATKANLKRINCDNYVSLGGELHALVDEKDITGYCFVRIGRKCNFTQTNVKFELIVNDSSYDMGSDDCTYNYHRYYGDESSNQGPCYPTFRFGTEDLDERGINGDDLEIKCKASVTTSGGLIEGISQAHSLKVFRGRAHDEECFETKPCMSGHNLTCISNRCSCLNQNGVDFVAPDKYGINTCLSRVGHNDKCINSLQCNLGKYGNIYPGEPSHCIETGIGKLCQCKFGYYWDEIQCQNVHNERVCPSCNCNSYPRDNSWDIYVYLILFFCGIIAGIFTYKIGLYCIKKTPVVWKATYIWLQPIGAKIHRTIYEWGQPIGVRIRNNLSKVPELSKTDNQYSSMDFDKQDLGKELDSMKTKSNYN